ncbi:hypothetical protein PghCCS26_48000 [Paenibacillus glycanilyticus]|uniref:ATP-binding protein n=1 Tax=Paenibacillus glycanilyticus TaxID=126569 RepID=A0ABQ6NUC6_9BACL|nr:hypothetical protein [Paenibacillus glycanilyticus]GMK47670.1 hypothetical protein PghCCS26_48000 [Paenibacillus glycanilyticus]
MQYVTFRIIPHHTVLNSASRNFQRALYELFSVRHKPRREGFRIVTQPAPDFYWITQLTAESIAFYVRVPVDFAEPFRTKFRNHEQWRKSTIEPVADFELVPEGDNSELYALKYKRHDMFSLDFRYNEQNTPVREVLSVKNELADNEAVTIFIRQETVSRAKWKRLVDYAWESWDKGGVPQKAGIDPLRVVRGLANGVVYVLYEAHSLVADIMSGIERTFFHGGGSRAKVERPVFRNPERAELLVNGDLSAMTKNKRNLPVFKTSIRYAVTAGDEVKRGMLARSVAGAYGSLAGDNRLEPIKVNIRSRRDFTPTMMSVDELGKLTQLPTAELQTEFADVLTSNRRVEIELPRVFLDDSGILAGTATDRGETHNVYISTKNPDRLFYGRAYVGMQGMGKDQAMINLIVEAKRKHNIGAVIPDVINEQNGHRGMADALRDHLPAEDVIDIDLANTEHPIYLGLQSIVRNVKDQRIAADRIAEEITQFLMADADDDKFQTMDFLREAAKATMGDLQDIKYMFTSRSFRNRKIAELEDIFDMDTWRDYDRMTDKDGGMSGRQGQIYGPIQRRLGQIINSEFLKPIFCQSPNPQMDLYRWIDEGKVVIFRFPKEDVISRRVIELLMYWIVLNVFLIKVAQDGKTKSLGTYLVLNEPHQFLSPGLIHFMKRMLTEGRKKRLAPIFAFHNFKQFREYPGFVDILKTGINWHVFKNENIKMYEELMPQLSKTFTDAQQAMDATKQYQYIACWINDEGSGENPFVVDALPLVGKRYETLNNERLTKEHAQKYGRPVAEVLAEIKRREREARGT